jgi:hypothetical protein
MTQLRYFSARHVHHAFLVFIAKNTSWLSPDQRYFCCVERWPFTGITGQLNGSGLYHQFTVGTPVFMHHDEGILVEPAQYPFQHEGYPIAETIQALYSTFGISTPVRILLRSGVLIAARKIGYKSFSVEAELGALHNGIPCDFP